MGLKTLPGATQTPPPAGPLDPDFTNYSIGEMKSDNQASNISFTYDCSRINSHGIKILGSVQIRHSGMNSQRERTGAFDLSTTQGYLRKLSDKEIFIWIENLYG